LRVEELQRGDRGEDLSDANENKLRDLNTREKERGGEEGEGRERRREREEERREERVRETRQRCD
jgi:hypothetical protein